MMDIKPLVSIGMPVYNGERFIAQALDSLLCQDYDNFELFISDNASNDRTSEICLKYLAKDERIRYHRNERNLGIVKNFNRAFEFSKGKYFMWAGDHDLWHPSFISRLVSVLENDSSVVLAYPRTILIDVHNNPLEIMSDRHIDTRNMSVISRYKYVVRCLGWGNMVYGLIRRDALAKTGNYRNLYFADKEFISELSLRGTIAQADEPLFYRRRNRSEEEQDTAAKRESMLCRMDPSNAARPLKCSLWYLLFESYKTFLQVLISSSGIRWNEKIELFVFLSRFFASEYLHSLRS
jgi:glycosyltransferase involved in cell wall biosynthesis